MFCCCRQKRFGRAANPAFEPVLRDLTELAAGPVACDGDSNRTEMQSVEEVVAGDAQANAGEEGEEEGNPDAIYRHALKNLASAWKAQRARRQQQQKKE